MFPFLRKVKKIAKHSAALNIINVQVLSNNAMSKLTTCRKSIDVKLTRLLLINPRTERSLKQRVDYTLGCDVAEHKKAHQILKWAEHHAIAQSDDEAVHNQVLFSYIEIKAAADTAGAVTQLGAWCAAGFQKQMNLLSGPSSMLG